MFCNNCGAQNPDNGIFCVSCGQSLQAQAAPAYEAPPAAPIVDEAADAEANKLMGILSYLSILVLIPILTGDVKKSPFVKFHANQGLVLWIAGIIASVLYVIPILGWILGFVVGMGVLVFAILGIVSVTKGEKKPLPLVGGLTLLK